MMYQAKLEAILAQMGVNMTRCPAGISTADPSLREGDDPDRLVRTVAYAATMQTALRRLCHSMGAPQAVPAPADA